MNGSYNIHTLSTGQAFRLLDLIGDQMVRVHDAIDGEANTFLQKLSKVWEDEYAVDFAKDIKKHLDGMFVDFSHRTNDLKQFICTKANEYSKVAGLGTKVGSSNNIFYSNVDISCVKSSFNNSDDSGFIDNNAASNVLDSFDIMQKSCNKIMDTLKSDMIHSNAFGNAYIKACLVEYASDLSGFVNEELRKIKNLAQEKLSQTQWKYSKVSANHSSNSGGGNSVYLNNGGSNYSYGNSSTGDVFVTEGLSAGNGSGQSLGSNIASGAVSLASDTIELAKTAVEDPGLVFEAYQNTVTDGIKSAASFIGIPQTSYKAIPRNQHTVDAFKKIKNK